MSSDDCGGSRSHEPRSEDSMRITLHLDTFDRIDPNAYAILWLDNETHNWSREGHAGLPFRNGENCGSIPAARWSVAGTMHDRCSSSKGSQWTHKPAPSKGNPVQRSGAAVNTKADRALRDTGGCSASTGTACLPNAACSRRTTV